MNNIVKDTSRLFRSKKIHSHANSHARRGFTVIELMITISIMIVITSLVLVNYRKFDSNVILTTLSYDIGLSVRKAQSYGLSVKAFDTTSTGFTYAYGVHFDASNGNNTTYTLFADTQPIVPNQIYDGINSGEKVEGFKLQGGYTLDRLCVNNSGDVSCNSGGSDSASVVDITFKRPYPDATILSGGDQGTKYSTAVIVVRSPQGTTKKIIVRTTGQISVQ